MILFLLGGAFILGLCIFIHELGHYTLGRLLGVKAEIFSIGYGKGRLKKKIGDTTWQITAIPFGGYVKFYGDDDPDKKVSGSLNSLPPLKRMIPVLGGPLFNLILGFVVFLLLHSLSGPIAPRITLSEESSNDSPAAKAGLRNGDLVRKIDGKSVHSFIEMQQYIALSEGEAMNFEIERKEKTLEKLVVPYLSPSGISRIGLRMPGETYLKVDYPTLSVWKYKLYSLFDNQPLASELRAIPYLKDGDVILNVEGRKIKNLQDLQNVLGEFHGKTVNVLVKRERYPWFASWPSYEKMVQVPTSPEYIIKITELWDNKYKVKLSDHNMFSSLPSQQRALNFIKINGKAPGSFEQMYKKFKKPQTVQLEMGGRSFKAKLLGKKHGLMGFRPIPLIHGDYLPNHPSFISTFVEATRDLFNSVMVYPQFFKSIFTGRISFLDNAAGPVRIFGAAGIILETGFQNYLYLFATISIALCIMNLLPLPVVDGGHLVFFLYEALAGKAISSKIRENMHRLSFGLLLFLGLIIMYKDLLWLATL